MNTLMRKINDTRRANLRELVRSFGHGGTGRVAKAAGYSSPSYLSQMIGPNAGREVSEEVARKIEISLGLPVHYLDQERDDYGRAVAVTPTVDHAHFKTCATIAASEMATAKVKLPTEKFSSIVTLLLKHGDQSDDALHALAAQLIALSA